MATEQQLRDTVAVCLSILTRYRNGERSKEARDIMAAEVAAVVGCLVETDLAAGDTDEKILRPIERDLLMCYGHEAGRRLNAEFVDAFEAVGMELVAHK